MFAITYSEMTIRDFDDLAEFWQGRETGRKLSRQMMQAYLDRNPGMSFVAWHEGKIVGTVMCGHDGLRGYLHSLSVNEAFRRQGIGRKLVEMSLAGLRAEGIRRCEIIVSLSNPVSQAFWKALGWEGRKDIVLMRKDP